MVRFTYKHKRPGSLTWIAEHKFRSDVLFRLGSLIYFAASPYRVVAVGYEGTHSIPVIHLQRISKAEERQIQVAQNFIVILSEIGASEETILMAKRALFKRRS